MAFSCIQKRYQRYEALLFFFFLYTFKFNSLISIDTSSNQVQSSKQGSILQSFTQKSGSVELTKN